MRIQHLTRAIGAALVATLAACGGGGGDGPSTRDPLPTLSQDVNPTGERLDYRSRDYFPAAAGDSWTYEYRENGTTRGTLTRTASAGSGADIVITESSFAGSESSTYRRTSEGIVSVLPLADSAPPGVSQLVGNLLEYPEPFYAIGATRRIVRQGSWGEDLDDDGSSESFRFEVTQVLVGFETLTLPNATVIDVAHWRNVVAATLRPSDPEQPSVTVTSTEEAWWAPHVGLVRADRSVIDSEGVLPRMAYSIVLTGGSVGGKTLFAPEPDGTVLKLALVHNALVYDASRNRYYASLPGSVAVYGNRIAVVDPATGAVSYPAGAVGSEPRALALAADGSALFVGLNGSGELAKLRLPDFAELWRVRLPNVSFFGQMSAERIAVSPLDADVVAVSLMRANSSPRHGGVVLVRAGVLQPRMTQDHTGSNLIAFDANGQFVYGFNNETTEFGLRRIAVLADGLQEQQVVTAAANFATGTLDWSARGLVLGNAVYRAPDLALLGQVNVQGGGCRPLTVADRLVCLNTAPFNSQDPRLAVVDATSFVILSTPAYQRGFVSETVSEIVPGPAGQVALRMNDSSTFSPTTGLWLFTSATLR